jgi:hypothetical protein
MAGQEEGLSFIQAETPKVKGGRCAARITGIGDKISRYTVFCRSGLGSRNFFPGAVQGR